MYKLLSLVPKSLFYALLKYGDIPLRNRNILRIENLEDINKEQLNKLFLAYPSIEYEEDYLFLLWKCSSIQKGEKNTSIKHLDKIIPLTQEAKKSLELKNEQIVFSEPILEKQIQEYLFDRDFENSIKGGKALVEYYNLQSTFNNNYFSEEQLKKALAFRQEGVKSYECSDSILCTLITYDRYESFPPGALGYIYDTIKVLADLKTPQERYQDDNYKKTEVYQFFENKRVEYEKFKTLKILNFIDNSENKQLEKYKTHLSEDIFRLWCLAYLFLNFKEDFRESDGLEQSKLIDKVNHIRKKGPQYSIELAHAVYLTGFFFGFSKFYNAYYKKMELPFLRSSKKTRIEKAVNTFPDGDSISNKHKMTSGPANQKGESSSKTKSSATDKKRKAGKQLRFQEQSVESGKDNKDLLIKQLTKIKGIGESTASKITEEYGSKEEIGNATKEQLQNLLGEKTGERVFDHFK